MQNATAADQALFTLIQIIIDGWPECIKDVPHNLQKYHSSVSILMAHNGLILCWEALLITPLEGDDKLPTPT